MVARMKDCRGTTSKVRAATATTKEYTDANQNETNLSKSKQNKRKRLLQGPYRANVQSIEEEGAIASADTMPNSSIHAKHKLQQ